MHPKPLTQRSPAWMHYLVLKPNIRRDRPWCRILSAGKTVFRQFMGILPQSDPSLQQLARAFVSALVWRLAIAYPIRGTLS